MFIKSTSGDFMYYPEADIRQSVTQLPAGVYTPQLSPNGPFFKPEQTSGDRLVSLDTPVATKVTREIEDFFNPRITDRLARAGIKHRRGIILYGAPGTGKTSLVRALFPYLIESGAVILLESNADHLQQVYIPAIRLADPDRPIVLAWDEFEKNANYSYHELLRLLDGMNSPDHLLTIGTTNHLDKIPDQMRKRPSRFSLVLEMPALGDKERLAYAQMKFPMLDHYALLSCVEITDGKPLDYLEEACKLVLMGYDADEIRDRIVDVALSAAVDDDDDDD